MDRNESRVWERAHEEGTFDELSPEPSLVALVPLLRARGVQRVLDLGCGSGRHLMYLRAQGFQVIGVDFASAGLKRAAWMGAHFGSGIHLVRADMTALPLQARSFSAAISYHVIYHGVIDQVRRALREVRRTLRPGGIVRMNFLADSHHRFKEGDPVAEKTYRLSRGADAGAIHRFFGRDELEALLHDSGFRIRSVEGLLGDLEHGDRISHWLATFERAD